MVVFVLKETTIMENMQILTADLLEIIFDGRNKSYGAYDLRKTYNKRISYALTGTIFVAFLFVISAVIANSSKKNSRPQFIQDVNLETIIPDEIKSDPLPLPKQELLKLEMTQFTAPKITIDALVDDNDEIKPMEEMENTRIGNINQEGKPDDGSIVAPVESSIDKVEFPNNVDEYEKTFYVVQNPAEFPGGLPAWSKYLERNLNRDLPINNGAPAGKYTVVVSFTVDKNGIISDVLAENNPGYGTDTEAIRVIKKGPSWKPAVQNGRNVIYRHKQSITFQVAEE
jgi:protein TonB